MNVFDFVCVNVCGLGRSISARSKMEQKYCLKIKNALKPLFTGFKCVSESFKVERETGVEPATFSLGS
jgi:hypothetical protein